MKIEGCSIQFGDNAPMIGQTIKIIFGVGAGKQYEITGYEPRSFTFQARRLIWIERVYRDIRTWLNLWMLRWDERVAARYADLHYEGRRFRNAYCGGSK